ncbi:MFS transporter [Bosea sp. TWI1241]|uniref:MFS transporter n=1 Tax=Bosea sp. TWI1241 TaxID=3148904 RepID=UPI00320AC401
MTSTASDIVAPAAANRLPWPGLLALAMAGFVTILTEALPAGLLPQIGASLRVSEALAGQWVSVYALGSLLAAVPLTHATAAFRRRPVLLAAIAGFAVANSVTALSSVYTVTLAARFLAGVSAGLLWALIAGYAARMVADRLKGRAIAVAMVGTPLALSLGIPAGTLLGGIVGWRLCFGLMSLLSLLLILWVLARLPDFPGQRQAARLSPAAVLALPGIRPVLVVTLAFVLAHNLLYTYIAPVLAGTGTALRTDLALLVFGAAALLGIGLVGIAIDRRLRLLALGATALFIVACLSLAAAGASAALLGLGMAIWGLGFGGTATLFQTALARAAGPATDTAQSMLVTAWNLAIAGGGLFGGLLLDVAGARALIWAPLPLLILALAVTLQAKRHGFPSPQSSAKEGQP